ncbi:MAG: DUF5702 domain-containing protein [Oscillospiraceae bacterium]|nr:DUF5702 domain-containing protein [Oscillospiraceae bacterium]
MIIDASRLQSVRTNIQGAGDLVLNAALSEYDVMLEEMYGLFGNMKDTASMKPILEQYFKETIQGELENVGITDMKDDYVDQLSKDVSEYIFNENNHNQEELMNFINAQVVRFECDPVYQSALANPNIMKQQVVEFMKYKGPISIASTLLTKIKAASNVGAQNEAIQKQVECNEIEAGLSDLMKNTYKALVEQYDTYAIIIDIARWKGKNAPSELESSMESVKEAYKKATYYYLMQVNADKILENADYSKLSESVQVNVELSEEPRFEGITKIQYLEKLESYLYEIMVLMEEQIAEFQDNFGQFSGYGENPVQDEQNPNKVYKGNIEYNNEKANVGKTKDIAFEFGEVQGAIDNSSPRGPKANYPHFDNVQKGAVDASGKKPNAVWFNALQNPTGSSNEEKLENRYDEISHYSDREGPIKEFLQLKKNIERLQEKYDFFYWDYKMQLEDNFREEHDSEWNANELSEEWRAYLDDHCYPEYAIYEYSYKTINDRVAAYDKSIGYYFGEMGKVSGDLKKEADQHMQEGFSFIGSMDMNYQIMIKSLETGKDNLEKIVKTLEDFEKKMDEWKKSIDNVNSESVKDNMMNEYQQTLKRYDKKEVQDLLEVVKSLIPVVEAEKKKVESIQYLGEAVYKSQSASDAGKAELKNYLKLGGNNSTGIKFLDKMVNDKTEKAVEKIWKNADKVVARIEKEEGGFDIGWKEKIPMPTNISENSKIKNEVNLKTKDAIKNKTEELIVEFKYDKVAPDGLSYLRILDGVKDDTLEPIIYYNNLKLGDILSIVDGSKKVIDKKEIFIHKLIAEFSAEDLGEEKKESEKQDEEKPSPKESKENAKNASKNSKDANKKGEANPDNASGEISSAWESISSYAQSSAGTDMPGCDMADVNLQEGEDAKSSSGSDTIGSGLDIVNLITDALGNAVEGAYLEEYFTEMFSCRTDNLKSAGAGEEDSVFTNPKFSVSYLNGYGNVKSGADKQFSEKYVTSSWYGKEIEYILWGNTDLDANLTATNAMIYVIRFALNLIYVFTASDIEAFAFSIAAAVCVGPAACAIPIVKACVKILLALAESGIDVVMLDKGEDVKLFKDKESFVCSPTGLANVVKNEITDIAKETADKAVKSAEHAINTAISDIENQANKCVSDFSDKMTVTVDSYIKDQTKVVRETVRDAILQPIISQMSSISGEIVAIREFMDGTNNELVNEAIEDAVHQAFDIIKSNIASMGDGVAARILNKLMEQYGTDMETTVIGKLEEYYAENAIKIPSEADLAEEIMNPIDNYISGMNETIKTELDKVKNSLNDKFEHASGVASEEARSFVHEQFNQANQYISGSIDNMAEQLTGKEEGYDTKSATTGLTLNYKEYCKIFMLMFVGSNQDKMLQRAAVLIQLNVNLEKPENQKIDMTHANTLFAVRAECEMPTLFPWSVKATTDDASGDSDLSWDFSNLGQNKVTIKYCGVNGY